MGGTYPIRIQSMTNTSTLDTLGSVEQCKRIFDAGADYVRLTTPTIREAENLKNIRDELHRAGYKKPLIADVHFQAKIAEVAAQIVEKVRINPGNYSDKNSRGKIDFSEAEYTEDIEKIRENLLPLLKICKRNDTAIRIGTNHGSLSNRIMSRYGDTPEGMVASVLEFLKIMQEENFHQIVISLKSSNTISMIQAYRLMVQRMQEFGYYFPLHLGVTEAGEGEDGRAKSAVGIGTLLSEGVGDTIRVSLTEDPELEIPVAHKLIEISQSKILYDTSIQVWENQTDPFSIGRFSSLTLKNVGGGQEPIVISSQQFQNENESQSPDYFYSKEGSFLVSNFDQAIQIPAVFIESRDEADSFPINEKFLDNSLIVLTDLGLSFSPMKIRRLILELRHKGVLNPLIVHKNFACKKEDLILCASSYLGPLLCDGSIDGIWIANEDTVDRQQLIETSFNVLQASRSRFTKTEFISCPSCGRTQFELMKVLAEIKKQTSHLKGLKIAVMGCIVNGPGEMADAHYGYVGAAAGKVSIYRQKELIIRNIETEKAIQTLIQLIKEDGKWID